ncbi:Glutathionyl-hydroquinone reductase YqjG [Pelagimonas phthalicica]|uniref:Glutathionyl-hydroquinone reductase YqjG n=1 Tax=Pelagimonas phthalicica TaxID=1037362 RepID=A0A238J808_9RHOB|nr:glutathione S-transferase family protein [Pelagimonas phthalicica]TDS94611.1 putative glutathione S-transferase [Pelagimonas phthalicica]SMX26861.1 Glutathionyl-hydroquinone reductase YqjG [Pelagimonas phthalicica]
MGLLIDGKWHDQWYDTKQSKGRFVRQDAGYRNWITADGSAGPSGEDGFKAEAGRYHLYVSMACPWAHRTLIFRKLKGLEDLISVSSVHPDMGSDGWTFQSDALGGSGDHLYGFEFARDLYVKANPKATTRVTVPILWDKERETIVSNESSEIIRMFNSAFDGLTGNTLDLWPEPIRQEIENVNERIYHSLNNGVYKAGFATTQEAYEEAVIPLFETLDWLEERLGAHRYLMCNCLTEADWRLFTTLVRFDLVYHGHFKCNRARISDYPNLWAYLRELYQWPGVAETVDFDQISRHYHYSHETINPHRIVPIGPKLDFFEPHGRELLFAA